MLNKKGIFFSMISILFIILFVSFVLYFSNYNQDSYYKSSYYIKENKLTNLNETLFLSLQKYYGHEFEGIFNCSNGSYYEFNELVIQNSSSNTFIDNISNFILNDFGLNYSNWSYYKINKLIVDNSNSYSHEIRLNFGEFEELNLSIYFQSNSTDLSVTKTPTSDTNGTDLNLKIYNSTNGLFGSYSYRILPNRTSDNSFIINYLGESFNLTYTNYSKLILKKSSSNKEIKIKEFKLKIDN